MSDQGYTPTEQELVAAWIQAHQVPAWGGWADRESAPRTRIAEAHRGIAEVRREAAEKAWDEGYGRGNAHNGRRDQCPYREGATA